MNHPYIGAHGTVRTRPFHGPGARANDYTGTVVAVGQAGSINTEDGTYVVAIILRDTPHPIREDMHDDCPLSCFDPADIPALVAEVTRLRTALEQSIAIGCAAVDEALREGEEDRAKLATLESAPTLARAVLDARQRIADLEAQVEHQRVVIADYDASRAADLLASQGRVRHIDILQREAKEARQRNADLTLALRRLIDTYRGAYFVADDGRPKIVDHACRECVDAAGYSDSSVTDDFTCPYHTARRIFAGLEEA